MVHGAPGDQATVGYRALKQALVNHGYVVFDINNRGSSGYGKTFFEMDDRKHGEADLGDVVASKQMLVATGKVDPDRIGIIGGSHGGYMVLAALTLQPDAFKVGIDLFGISNWVRTLESIPAWWGSFREALYAEMGDPKTDSVRLRRISPLFNADKIKVPLMVLQGANDPRVLKIEPDEIVAEAKTKGVPVEYLVFPDALRLREEGKRNQGVHRRYCVPRRALEGAAHDDDAIALVVLIRDVANAPLAREVGGRPLNHDDQAVAETDQLEDVEEQPGEPRDEPGDPYAANIRNGRATSDDRHAAAVSVNETGRRLNIPGGTRFLHALHDHPRRVSATLHRHLRNAGQLVPFAVKECRGVANHERLRMPGHREVSLDDDAPGAIARNTEGRGDRRCGNASRPQYRARIEPLTTEHHAVHINAGDARILPNFDPQPVQRSPRRIAKLRRERRKNRWPGFDQHDASGVRVDVAELGARLACDLGKRSGQLDAGRTAADQHERQQPLLAGGVRLALGQLEGDQNPAPDGERILEGLQTRRIGRPFVMAEIGVAGARRHNQVVVVDGGFILERDAPGVQIDRTNIAEQHSCVAVVTYDPADGRCDIARGQRRRCDLVEQRLEEVVVVAVDDRDADRRLAQGFGGGEATEAAADDHHVWHWDMLVVGAP